MCLIYLCPLYDLEQIILYMQVIYSYIIDHSHNLSVVGPYKGFNP